MKTVLISKLLFTVVVASMFYTFVYYRIPSKISLFKGSNKNLAITSVIFSGIVYGVLVLANIWDRESYKAFPSLKPNMCRGGSYMWSGDGEFSKMCRDAKNSPEGRCAIASANCAGPGSMRGQPKNFPKYSSNSDSNWKGIPCCNKKPLIEDHETRTCNCLQS